MSNQSIIFTKSRFNGRKLHIPVNMNLSTRCTVCKQYLHKHNVDGRCPMSDLSSFSADIAELDDIDMSLYRYIIKSNITHTDLKLTYVTNHVNELIYILEVLEYNKVNDNYINSITVSTGDTTVTF